MSARKPVRPNDAPPRIALRDGVCAWLDGETLRLAGTNGAEQTAPLPRPLGLAVLGEGAIGLGAPPGRGGDLELVRLDGRGGVARGALLAYAAPERGAFLFLEDDGAHAWLVAPGPSPALLRFALPAGEERCRVVAGTPLVVDGPRTVVRLPGGDFLVAGFGFLLRVRPPRVRDEGAEVRDISDADWQRDLRQLCRSGGDLVARGPDALHVLAGDEPTRRVAHHEVTGETVHRLAGAEGVVAALSCAAETSRGPSWALHGYDSTLRPRWRRELGDRWGWERLDVALDAERVVVLGVDGKRAWFDAASGAPLGEGS